MAGKIIADIIEAPYDSIRMNVANVTVLTANSSGLTYLPTGNVNINVGSTTSLTLGNVTVSNLLTTNGGIKFPATQVSSADGNTLDDYEEGTWTPTDASGAGLTLSGTNTRYTKVGNIVVACAEIVYPSTANGSAAKIGGLPFTNSGSSTWGGFQRYTNKSLAFTFAIVPGNTIVDIYKLDGNAVSNANLSAGRADLVVIYTV